MLKPELVAGVAKEVGITKASAERAVNFIMLAIAGAIACEGRFAYEGFGVFKKVRRAACQKHNPQNPGQKIPVPAHNTVKFKPAPALKDLVKS
jgi:DNA-binding protein HU-beta